MHTAVVMVMSLAMIQVLFAPVHSLNVMEIVVFQFLSLQFKSIRDQACFRGPRLWTQVNLHRDLKTLKFNCNYTKKGMSVRAQAQIVN